MKSALELGRLTERFKLTEEERAVLGRRDGYEGFCGEKLPKAWPKDEARRVQVLKSLVEKMKGSQRHGSNGRRTN